MADALSAPASEVFGLSFHLRSPGRLRASVVVQLEREQVIAAETFDLHVLAAEGRLGELLGLVARVVFEGRAP